MALIKCKECSKKISDQAKTCMSCGFDMTEYAEIAKKKAEERKARVAKKWKDYTTLEKASTIFAATAGGAILFAMTHCALAPKTAEEIAQEDKVKAVESCWHAIRRAAAFPDSVHFNMLPGDVPSMSKKDEKLGLYEFEIPAKAKNAFGMSISSVFYCKTVKLAGEGFTVAKLRKIQ